jgi:tellurite resistance protein TerC
MRRSGRRPLPSPRRSARPRGGRHPAAPGQFFAGWLTEYSLSVDNLFVFVLPISRSPVPRELHRRVLLLGVALALLLRGIFIALGASALHRFGWLL